MYKKTNIRVFFSGLFFFSLMACGKKENFPVKMQENKKTSTLKIHFINEQAKYKWSESYSEKIAESFDEKIELESILDTKLNALDLEKLQCPGYLSATREEKKQFWILFIASVAFLESNLNPQTTYREKDGSLSSGLLQIDVASANRHTFFFLEYVFNQDDLYNTELNLLAGLYILKHQLQGGINRERTELIGRIFTDRSYYWSILTLKQELFAKNFIQNSLANLPFCFI